MTSCFTNQNYTMRYNWLEINHAAASATYIEMWSQHFFKNERLQERNGQLINSAQADTLVTLQNLTSHRPNGRVSSTSCSAYTKAAMMKVKQIVLIFFCKKAS